MKYKVLKECSIISVREAIDNQSLYGWDDWMEFVLWFKHNFNSNKYAIKCEDILDTDINGDYDLEDKNDKYIETIVGIDDMITILTDLNFIEPYIEPKKFKPLNLKIESKEELAVLYNLLSLNRTKFEKSATMFDDTLFDVDLIDQFDGSFKLYCKLVDLVGDWSDYEL